jgi:hypothetical protein
LRMGVFTVQKNMPQASHFFLFYSQMTLKKS